MAEERKVGSKGAARRASILAATEEVMLEEGYAAVTSRSVAARAGIHAPLVHYYFPTLDDLFIAVVRRGADRSKERFAAAMASPEPLRALWELSLDPRGTSLLVELLALSNHRKAVQEEIAERSRETLTRHIEAFAELLDRYGIDTEDFPPELAALTMGGLARMIVREEAIGVTTGHAEALAVIDRHLDRIHQRHPESRPST